MQPAQSGLSPNRLLPWIVAGVMTLGGLAVWWTQSNYEAPVDQFVDFGAYHYGVVPAEFEYDATGAHGPVLTAGRPYWRVFVDRFAPSPAFVMIQGGTREEADHYALALLREVQAKNVTLSVYLKPMGGKLDKSAGLIWRVQDKDNYYAAFASALDDQVHLFKMVRGSPAELAKAPIPIDVEFERTELSPTGGWYPLKVEAKGTRIQIWFQNEKVLEISDPAFTTAGRVGLATHADSVAAFDNFHVQVGGLIPTVTPLPVSTPIN
jgi:hypothetical protein